MKCSLHSAINNRILRKFEIARRLHLAKIFSEMGGLGVHLDAKLRKMRVKPLKCRSALRLRQWKEKHFLSLHQKGKFCLFS